MDSNNKEGSGPGLFTGLPGLGGGVGGGAGMGQLSPYLNIDPSYLQNSAPEYIFDTEAKRGKLEKSFTAIGSSVCIGAGIGGAYGLYDGVRQTALGTMSGRLRRTQITNYTLKSGALISNALGSIAVSYSLMYCLLSLAHEDNDEAKSVVSGTLTGLMFKSTSGMKTCAKGGLVGFGLSALWAFGLKKQDSVQHYI